MIFVRLLVRLLPALVLAVCLPAAAQAYLLETSNVVFLVRTGTNSDGTPAFRVATDRDAGAARIFQLASQSSAIDNTAKYYEYAQELRNQMLEQQMGSYGLSAGDRQLASSLLRPDPVFVEIREGSGGTYNDWKGNYTINSPNGGVAVRVQDPRVVLPLGSSEATSGNAGLLEQTLVHEAGHGVMAKAYGVQNLPDSPLLSREHSGGEKTDAQLAIIEGWAEFCGAYFTNRLTIANDPRNAITDNLYSYDSAGRPKSGTDLMQTEGWVATALWFLASRSGIQNALQKITITMVETHPASLQQLLDNFMQAYPSDAQKVRSTIAQVSHGALYGYGAGGPNGYGVAGAQGYGTPLSSQYTQALDQYVRLRYAYLAGGNDYYAGERTRIGQAAQQQAQTLQAMAARLRQQVLSGQGSGDTMVALNQNVRKYRGLASEVQSRLGQTPWYAQGQRAQLQAEAQALNEVLSYQSSLVSALEQPPSMAFGQPGNSAVRYYGPGAPASSKQAYKNLLDALKSGNQEGIGAAYDAYQNRGAPGASPDESR